MADVQLTTELFIRMATESDWADLRQLRGLAGYAPPRLPSPNRSPCSAELPARCFLAPLPDFAGTDPETCPA